MNHDSYVIAGDGSSEPFASRANSRVAHPLHLLSSPACACSPFTRYGHALVEGYPWPKKIAGLHRWTVETARDRQQGRARSARQGHRARVERRGSSRGRPQGRAGEPPQAPSAATRLVRFLPNSPCDSSSRRQGSVFCPASRARLRPPIGSRYSWRFVAQNAANLLLGGRSTVGHGALDAVIGVQSLPPSQLLRSWLGRQDFVETSRLVSLGANGSESPYFQPTLGGSWLGRQDFVGNIAPRFTRREWFRSWYLETKSPDMGTNP